MVTESLRKLIKATRVISKVDAEMSIQQIQFLLLLAKYTETNSSVLCEELSISSATLSRNTKKFGVYAERDPSSGNLSMRGLDFIVAGPDPAERRRFVYRLTPKGNAFVTSIVDCFCGGEC